MKKKRGLCMAAGGLIKAAAGYAQGGIVRGPGGPEDDEVPMQIAGKDVRLSNTEAVLPARTVQALGGPEAVEQLIEQTNEKPPVKGGLRQGGKYFTGVVTARDIEGRPIGGDYIDKNELRPEFRGNAAGQPVTPAANAGAQARQNTAAQTHMNKMPDADPVRAQQAAQANAQANATGPKLETPTNPNYAKAGPSPEAAKFAETQNAQNAKFAEAGAPKPGAPGAPHAETLETPKSRLGNAVGGAKSIGGKLIKGAGYTMAAMGAADAVENGLTVQNAAEMAGGVLSSDAGRAAVMNTVRGAAPLAGAAGATLGVGAAAAGGYMYGSALRDKAESGEKMNRLEATLTATGENLGKAYARYAPEWAGGLDKRTIELADKENGGAGWTTIKSLREGDPQKQAAAAAKAEAEQAAANQTQAGEKSPVGATVVEGPQPDGQQAIDPVTKLPVGLAAAAKANDGRADFNATMDATKYNPAEGTGVITRAPGKDGLRSGTFIGGASAADAARDAKFEAAGYGKDMYGNWMTPQRIALQQAGKDWEDRNYSKQVTTEEQKAASSQTDALRKSQQELIEKALTPHKGSMNGQLTTGQISRAREILSDMQSSQQHAAELGLSQQKMDREKAASEGKPGFRDLLEAQKFQYQIAKDREQTDNLQGNNDRDYLAGRMDKYDKKVSDILDRYSMGGEDGKTIDPQKRSIVEKFMANFNKTYDGPPEQYFAELEDHLAVEQVLEAQGRSGFTNWGEKQKPWSGDLTTGIEEDTAPWYRMGDSKIWKDEYGRRYGSEIEKRMTPRQWEIFKAKYLKQQQQQQQRGR